MQKNHLLFALGKQDGKGGGGMIKKKFDYSIKTRWILSLSKVMVASSTSVSLSHSVLINVSVIV